jgi:hypothetical protein
MLVNWPLTTAMKMLLLPKQETKTEMSKSMHTNAIMFHYNFLWPLTNKRKYFNFSLM